MLCVSPCVCAYDMLVPVILSSVSLSDLKIWDLMELDRHDNPTLVRSHTKLSTSQTSSAPVTVLAIAPDLTQIAVGFANGSIMYCEGNITKERFHKVGNVS